MKTAHTILDKLSRSTRLTQIIIVFAAFAFCGGVYELIATFAETPSAAGNPISCNRAIGPFKDRGTELIQGDGTEFIPYGLTVPGLAHAAYQNYATDDINQIQSASTYWCANTVRLQVAQDNLVGATGKTYSKPFMDAIKAEVGQAENLGLVVVINAQTEDVGAEPGPTSATVAFWKALTGVYGSDPQVIFDIFNEPRDGSSWRVWQRGGTYRRVTYLGMQQISDGIRADGAKNLIWIEGPGAAQTLSRVSSYPVTRDGSIMYAIHHPVGAHNSSVWWADFGYLITRNIAPVVVGEWTNYASSKGECWGNAPTAVPAFLNYLENHHIGMTAWALRQGVMAASSDLSDPTRIESNWRCKDNLNGANGPNEGAGHQIMQWFIRHNAT